MSLRCALGLHTGQAEGGTMMFTCPRCGGSFWQRADMSDVTRAADAMLDAGRVDDANAYVREEVKRRTR